MTMTQRELSENETFNLISADKVEGTAVYGPDGDNLGSIHKLMIDKVSGRVSYAVMSFGGFLGLGEEYHPLPWEMLDYDTDLGGYRVNLTREQLEGAPRYAAGTEPDWADRTYGRKVHDYYGVPPYWAGI